MAPSDNLLNLLSESSSSYDVTSYYITCNGTNPLQTYYDDAYTYLDSYKVVVNGILTTSCPNNPYLLDSIKLSDQSKDIWIDSEQYIQCPLIQKYYQNIVNDGKLLCVIIIYIKFIIYIYILVTLL